MPQDFKNLEVWKDAYDFALDIYKLTIPFPQNEQFGITSQLRRAAVSVSSNIAEGSGKNSGPDFVRFLYISIGSLKECENLLRIYHGLGYLKEVDFNNLIRKTEVLGRKLYRLSDLVENNKK